MLLPIKSFIRAPAVSLAVIIAVAILLPILAVLQYRWLGEVSQAERERLQAAVHAGAEQFRQDFDQEILRVFLTFQLETGTRDPDVKSELASRYDSWVSDAHHAKLVRSILVAKRNPDGRFSLARFHPESADLQTCDWPDELVLWRDRIEQAQKSLPPQVREAVESILGGKLQESGASRATILANLAPFIADEVPALFIPTMSRANLNDVTKKKQPFFMGYTIVELDGDYVRKEFLPALVMKRFGSDNRLDYKIDVVRKAEPLKPVFQSDPLLQLATPSTSDTAMELFSLRMEDLRSLPIRDLLQGFRGGPSGVGVRGGVTMNLYSAPANASVRAASAPPRIDEGRWLLMVTHRAGSLEAAVGRVRRRNLIVSAGVLSLLVASVALVGALAQRSRRLARQQIVFVAGVSHELRTPLAVIRSAGDNLADGIIADGPRVRHYGELIRTEGERLSEMVERILEFSGIRSRLNAYDFRATDVASLIEAALAECRLTTEDSDFRVEQNVGKSLPMVMGDASALSGALQNLLRNAMKYSLDNRRWIGVAARALRNGRRGGIEITIEDRGIGIAPGDLPHIFEPFYRGKAVVDSQIHGNGLGLSLVKHIVEAHKGQVSVKSTLGKGTVFTVHLPISKAGPNQSPDSTRRA